MGGDRKATAQPKVPGERLCPRSYFPAPSAEPPQFVREPERHITAEMEKVVAIPCQAKGELLPGTLPVPPPPRA